MKKIFKSLLLFNVATISTISSIPFFINKSSIKKEEKLLSSYHSEDSSSQINQTDEMSYPDNINFVLESLASIMPSPENVQNGQFRKIENFVQVSRTILNSSTWSSIEKSNTKDVTSSFYKLLNWYINIAFISNEYVEEFPDAARKSLSDEGIDETFKLINNIPKINLDVLKEKTMKLTFPKLNFSSNNIINKNFKGNTRESIPNLRTFQHKVISIDTSKINDDMSPFSFNFDYQENNGTRKKRKIIFSNKNNNLQNDKLKIEDLINNFNIFSRDIGKNVDVKTDKKSNVTNKNIKFVRNGNKIDVYIELHSQEDKAFLSLDNSNSQEWDEVIEVGFLESTFSPKNIRKLLNNIETIIPTSADFNKNLYAFGDRSKWSNNPKGEINGNIKPINEIKLYALGPCSITLPIIYSGEKYFGKNNEQKELEIQVHENGDVKVFPEQFKISSNYFSDEIEKINVLNRKSYDKNNNLWTEILIKSDQNIVIGEVDVFTATSVRKPSPEALILQSYNALEKHFFFEKPLEFSESFQTNTIGYEKLIDEKKDVAKLLGEYYYSAWNFYPTKQIYNIVAPKNVISLENVIKPILNSQNELTNQGELWNINPNDRPLNSKLVQNGIGVLLEKFNKYNNLLNATSKKITKKNLFEVDPENHYKPSKAIDAQKFALDRLIENNDSPKASKAIKEISIALNIYFNGQNVLTQDYDPKEKVEEIEEIKKITQRDKSSLINFASKRIQTIILEKQKEIYVNFLKKLDDYRLEMLTNLMNATKEDYGNIFKKFNNKLITMKSIKIGKQMEDMKIMNHNKYNSLPSSNFKEQIYSIIDRIMESQKIEDSLNKENTQYLKNNLKILKEPLDTGDKSTIIKTTRLLFKIIDNYSDNKTNNLLTKLWNFKKYIKEDSVKTKKMIEKFSLFVDNLNKNKNYYSTALSFTAKVSDIEIFVASYNIKKIFNLMLNIKKWGKQEIENIKKARDFDYQKNPHQIAEIAVKIKQLNIQKFYNDITKDNISRVAERIFEMDPNLEIPTKLPRSSLFANVIKSITNKLQIIWGIIGAFLIILGMLTIKIGYSNKKSTLVIGVVFSSIGIVMCICAALLIPIGSIALLAI